MPVSQINPDGTVKIYNTKTGAVADVKPEELANYSPALVGQYQAKLQDVQSTQAAYNMVKHGASLDQIKVPDPVKFQVQKQMVQEGGQLPTALTTDQQKKKTAIDTSDRIVSQLEDLYTGGGSQPKLAYGRLGGILELAKEKAGYNSDLHTYLTTRQSTRPTLARAAGDVGNLTGPEQEAAIAQAPTEFSTPDEAIKGFKELRRRLNLPARSLTQDQKKNEIAPPPAQNPAMQMLNQPGLQIDQKQPQKQSLNLIPKAEASMGPVVQEDTGGKSTSQNASSFLRSIGLGVFPDAGAAVTGAVNGGIDSENPFITPEEFKKVKQEGQMNTAKDAAGVGSYLVAPEAKAAVLSAKFLGPTAASGALAAAGQEGFDPKKMLQGAAGAEALGAMLHVPGAFTGHVKRQAEGFINQLFKPTGSAMNEFRRNTGLNFAQEVIKRDLPHIKGKTAPEILDYYNSKLHGLSDAADKFLGDHGGDISKLDLLDLLNKHAKTLTPANNRVLQGQGKNALESLADEIHLMPDRIKLSDLNQIKRDIQTAGQSAFGPSGSSSPTSNALAGIQKGINKILEKEAPGIKDVNKSIQFYRLAKDSIQSRVDQASKSEGGLVTQLLTGGAGAGVTAGLVTGNPALAAAGVIPLIANGVYRNSRFKTAAADAARKIPQAHTNTLLQKILTPAGGRSAGSL